MRVTIGCIRTLTALVCVSLLALALSVPAASAAGNQGRLLHFIVHLGPGNRSACRIVGMLYRPAGASPNHRVPAVLTTNGFGGSYRGQIPLARNLAAAGFAVLTYSGLGFGGSSCHISMDSPQWDGKAASQLITFLGGGMAATDGTRVNYVVHDRTAHNGRHYHHDPRVGMIGGSYGGEVQFAAAATDPRLDTIVPIITWNSLQYSLAPNDAGDSPSGLVPATPGITKRDWLDAFVLVGETSPKARPFGGASPCSNFAALDCPAIAELDSEGYPNQATTRLAASDSVSSYMRRIRIPVMLMQGEDDTLFNLNEAIATYRALGAQHTPVRMVWQSWGHSDPTPLPGEIGPGMALDSPNGSPSVEGLMVKLWFDHYLEHSGPVPALNFSFYRPWVSYRSYDAAAAYASAPHFPIGKPTPLYLSAAPPVSMGTSNGATATGAAGAGGAAGADSLGTLTSSAATVTGGSLHFEVPASGEPQSQTDDPGQSQSMLPLGDPAGTYAEFESAPLAADAYVVGTPRVTVTAQAPASSLSGMALRSDLGLFVKLEDITPDGTATLPDRLMAAARFPDDGRPVTITLPGIVHEFPAGDRIALVIAGSDSSYIVPDPGAPVTITTGSADPGVLSLPLARAGSYTHVVYSRKGR